MIKTSEKTITLIDKKAKKVSIPMTAKYIGPFACERSAIALLNLKKTRISIIGGNAFSFCSKLKKVTFPSSLKKICNKGFFSCDLLQIVNFPVKSRLKKIGESAFSGCENLKYFKFPHLLEFIGDYAFFSVIGWKKIDFRGTKLRYLGKDIVDDQSEVVINFPSTIRLSSIINYINYQVTIEERSPIINRDECGYYISFRTIFQGKKNLKRLLIRRGVEFIEKHCFANSALVSITIPASVVEISPSAFNGSKSLKRVRFAIGSQLKEIGKQAFHSCSINKIRFPKSLKYLRENAFSNNESLIKVFFPPDSQLELFECPFSGTAIKQLLLPQAVKKIEGNIKKMENLTKIIIKNEFYESNEEGTAIFSKDRKELISVLKNIQKIEIPSGVRVIKKEAFYCSLITGKIFIPASVEIIEDQAFYNCCRLSIIEFEEGSRLKSFGSFVFEKLEDLIISNELFKKKKKGSVLSLEDPKNPKLIFGH